MSNIPTTVANPIRGILKRPWRRVKKFDETEIVFVMVRRNYKIYTNIGFSKRSTKRWATILDTRSGPTFIRKAILHESVWNLIKSTHDNARIRNANNKSVKIEGTSDLFFNIGMSMETVKFNILNI